MLLNYHLKESPGQAPKFQTSLKIGLFFGVCQTCPQKCTSESRNSPLNPYHLRDEHGPLQSRCTVTEKIRRLEKAAAVLWLLRKIHG